MDHGQANHSVRAVFRPDPTLNGPFDSTCLRSENGQPLFPSGVHQVAEVGTILVVSREPSATGQTVQFPLHLAAIILLRPATAEEVRQSWHRTQHPLYVEQLTLDPERNVLVPTGRADGFVPF